MSTGWRSPVLGAGGGGSWPLGDQRPCWTRDRQSQTAAPGGQKRHCRGAETRLNDPQPRRRETWDVGERERGDFKRQMLRMFVPFDQYLHSQSLIFKE